LFYLTENALIALDKGSDVFTANLPLYFTLQIASELGFQLLGAYSEETSYFDLQEGMFTKEEPSHPYYLEGEMAKITSQILHCKNLTELENILLNRTTRRELLSSFQTFLTLHIHNFGEIKSLAIIQEVLR
ncbi:MAG TPA: DNA repair protein RecO C-terminal domain-containing protein, partial [Sediminibacterium sp.]|nr:DNA repair protein RecO C-terminal domain-containing protein [Sediminibacterium sp.]